MHPLSRRSKAILAGVALALIFLAGLYGAGDALLNHFARPRLEEACAAHLPGSALHLGALHFNLWRNCLRCDSLELTLKDGARTVTGPITVLGMRWARLLFGERNAEQLTRSLRFEISDVSAETLSREYRVQCESIRLSVPDSSVVVQGVKFQPTADDEAFFAADPFRRIRYKLAAASLVVRGVRFAGMLGGRDYRLESVELQRPVLDSYVDREKPPRPPAAAPRMPQELLASVAQPVRIDRIAIVDGAIRMAARRSRGAEPGVLTFHAVQLTAKNIANVGAGGRMIEIFTEGRLMDAGTMKVQMQIPVAPPTLTLHYSGTLAPMDLTSLDQYLDGAARFKIRSGTADGAAFDIDVTDGHARGYLRGVYGDFKVSLLDRKTGSEKGGAHRVASAVVNELKVRRDNFPGRHGEFPEAKIDYVRSPEDAFLQFAWKAVYSGIHDLMTR